MPQRRRPAPRQRDWNHDSTTCSWQPNYFLEDSIMSTEYGISYHHFESPSRNRWNWSSCFFACSLFESSEICHNTGYHFIKERNNHNSHTSSERESVIALTCYASMPSASRKWDPARSMLSPSSRHVCSSMESLVSLTRIVLARISCIFYR